MNEAAQLLAEGAAIEDLDGALVDFGFPVGPITLLDEVGIDVGEKVGKILHDAFGARMAPPAALHDVVAAGRLGRKNKKGFYTTTTTRRRSASTSRSTTLPGGRAASRSRGRDPRARRVQMVNEAIRCLGEGILRSARDGDVGAVFGLGFPPFRGGPFRYADTLGAKELPRPDRAAARPPWRAVRAGAAPRRARGLREDVSRSVATGSDGSRPRPRGGPAAPRLRGEPYGDTRDRLRQ